MIRCTQRDTGMFIAWLDNHTFLRVGVFENLKKERKIRRKNDKNKIKISKKQLWIRSILVSSHEGGNRWDLQFTKFRWQYHATKFLARQTFDLGLQTRILVWPGTRKVYTALRQIFGHQLTSSLTPCLIKVFQISNRDFHLHYHL